jgi:tetratricopeptide (TPR) repeat protein
MTRWSRTAVALLLAATGLGWLDPHHAAREAGGLYAEGKYEEAATKLNEALVDDPDSALLHFNLGDATYRQGKYDEALRAFGDVPARADDPGRSARVAYNVGNTKYRLGQAAEASDPKAALGHYAEALVAYRRALGAAPDDVDTKFNYEFVERKMTELQKRLEEQKKQQEEQQKQQQDQAEDQQDQQEQPQDQQEQQEQQQEQAEDGQPKEEPKDEQAKEGQPPEQPQQQAEQQPPSQEPSKPEQQAGGAGETGEAEPGEMSEQEAAALLEGQRGEEVKPEEVVKRLQRGVVGAPSKDW